MAVTPDTFFGATLTFGTLTLKSLDILSGGLSGVSATQIDTTHAGTSGDVRTKIPADLLEPGTYNFDVMYDPDDDIWAKVGVEETAMTVTFPLPSGKITPAKFVFKGNISDWGNELPIDEKMTATITLQIQDDPVHTAAA